MRKSGLHISAFARGPGILVALDSYPSALGAARVPVLDGLSGDQPFLLSWAQRGLTKLRNDALRNQSQRIPMHPW
jgi:putative endopeptidase